jgi:phosphatidylglycerophosphatase A
MSMLTAPKPRADWRFMLRNPAHIIAFGFGSGLAPKAPGTFGTLLGWWMFAVLPHDWTLPILLLAMSAAFFVGVWVCAITGRNLGVSDHGAMVWDEMVAIWLVLLFTPAGWWWQALAVCLFRVFDITKPAPIRQVERKFKGGFGVMIDDVLAAAYALLVLALVRHGLHAAGVAA